MHQYGTIPSFIDGSVMKNMLIVLVTTLFVGAAVATAQTNYALSFNNSLSTYISIPYNAAQQPTAALTVEAWVNVNSWAGTPGIVGNTEFGGYELEIEQISGVNRLNFWVKRNNNYAVTYITQAAFGTGWHHVAGTFDGRFARIYLDGVLQNTDDAGGIYSIQYTYQNSLIIGAEAASGSTPFGYYFNGSINDVRIWNYARPADSILAAKDRELAGTESGLTGYWTFNEGSGTTVNDLTANGQTGTLYSGPEWIVFDTAHDWYTLGAQTISDGTAYYLSTAIGSDGTPYVGYSDAANFGKATVMTYDGSAWVPLGTKGFSSGAVNDMDIAIASNGTVYAAYSDAGNSGKATVKKFLSGSWTDVGTPGFSAGSVSDIQISVTSAGVPYVGYTDAANSNKPTAMVLNSGTWTVVGSAGITSAASADQDFRVSPSGVPYFVVRSNSGSQQASVLSYNGSSWGYVGVQNFSTNTAYYVQIAFAPDETPYVIYVDNGVQVKKYDGSWTSVGSAISSIYTSPSLPQLAFSSDGTPYVCFLQGSYLVVKRYIGSSWQFVGTAPITQYSTTYPTIAVSPSGVPYECHTETSIGSKATLRRFTTSAGAALPVELHSFSAERIGGSVVLRWYTASEQSNAGFAVEQRSAAGVWNRIGFVEGHGTTNEPQQYRFTTAGRTEATAFRLQQIDRDGNVHSSSVVEVSALHLPSAVALSQNYPDPFNPSTTIRYAVPNDGPVSLRVYDMVGREAAVLVNSVQPAGEHTVTFDASRLSSGVYLYQLRTGAASMTKRMVLLR